MSKNEVKAVVSSFETENKAALPDDHVVNGIPKAERLMKNNEKKDRRQREIWYDGRSVPLEYRDIWGAVNNSNIKKVLVTKAQRGDVRWPLKTELITEITRSEDLDGLPAGETVMASDRYLLDLAKGSGYRTCLSYSISDRQALDSSWREAINHDYLVVDFDLPTNIPLELIIARLQNKGTALLKQETSLAGLEVVMGVLETGSDGVLLATTDISEIIKVSQYLYRRDQRQIDLLPLRVKEVRHIGMGARACIDTTGLMTQEEGMIVGSTSSGGVFVCSETHYLPYMNLRPFRVNAGAVHSYVWMPDNAAEYLTDLQAGSKVLCVNTRGESRVLTVGRIKIEMRPLLLILGGAGGQEINVIVQDDWHIRLMGVGGHPLNATTIVPGTELLAYVCEPGRHVGIKVDETIIEK